jgi:hypothetical protein
MAERVQERSARLRDVEFSLWFRLLGVLPLAFFLGQAIHYWRIDQLGHMLWMCNIGNLLLAIGIFLGQPILIRVAVIWSIPGIVIWFRYVVMVWGVFAASTSVHVGGLIVGLLALRKVGVDRAAWRYAFAWYLILQLLSRLVTPAELNVNVAHHMYQGWERVFSAYWKFWLVMTLLVAGVLWLLSFGLRKVWPQDRGPGESENIRVLGDIQSP